MDAKQSAIIEQYQNAKLVERQQQGAQNDDFEGGSADEDDLLDQLENEEDEIFTKYREARISQLSSEIRAIESTVGASGEELGALIAIHNEKELMSIMTQGQGGGSDADAAIVIHFQQPEFSKCKIMNERLSVLAEKHLQVRFYSVNAVDAPFLVTKLAVKVLPFVVAYRRGKEVLRVVGFEKLGNNPNTFAVEALEQLMYMHGVINRRAVNYGSIKHAAKPLDADSDDDLDL